MITRRHTITLVMGITAATTLAISADGSSTYVAIGTRIYSVDVKRRALRTSASVYSNSDGKRSEVTGFWTPSISTDGKTLFVAWDCVGILKSINAKTLKGASVPVAGKIRWGARSVATDPVLNSAYAISKTALVTVNTNGSSVRGIDPAVPSGSTAEHVVATNSSAVVSWEANDLKNPNQVVVTMLTLG